MTSAETPNRGANVRLLIDAIVRQVTVLLAELATSRGLRAPLASVAEQVFIELSRELESHGISRPVSADMFGLALRTYLRRIRRFDESATLRGRSLWEAVLEYVQERRTVPRGDVLAHFAADDDVQLKGILQDLTDSGLIFRSGVGAATLYRCADDNEPVQARGQAALDDLLWVLVRREGPFLVDALVERTTLSRDVLTSALDRLTKEGRLRAEKVATGLRYRADAIVIPLGQGSGWEAAVYDHLHAVVKTIICKLRLETAGARADDRVGGSTYTFEVWDGHPFAKQVYNQLASFREAMSELRRKVDDYNSRQGRPPRYDQVTAYVGQCLIQLDGGDTQ